jgi:CRP/FNR family cyclic AMP-dependent transcriptional regulator
VHRLAIFEDLNEDLIGFLKPLFESYSCPAGTVIFQQGDRAESLYLVIDGKVDMSFKPYDGIPLTISHVGQGGVFGWSAMVGSDTYTSTALAIEDLEAFRLHGSRLRSFCREHPEAGQHILERFADGVSGRWKDAHRQVQSILYQGMIDKIDFI